MYPLSDWLAAWIVKSKPVGLPIDATVTSIKALKSGPLYGTVELWDTEPEPSGQKWGSAWKSIVVAESPVGWTRFDKNALTLHYDRPDGSHTTYMSGPQEFGSRTWTVLDARFFYQDNKTSFLFYVLDGTRVYLASGEPYRHWVRWPKIAATQWVFNGRF
jgi:hypothetical protein